MKLAGLLTCLLCFGLAAWAQQESDELRVNVKDLHYSTLAASARIQGDVVWEVSRAGQKLISGNALLAEASRASLATWSFPMSDHVYRVSFHFALVDGPIRRDTILIGDKFDRLFLRLFRAPTHRVVEYNACLSPPADPATSYTFEPSNYAIDVFITGSPHCSVN